jgi:hypothetical protein
VTITQILTALADAADGQTVLWLDRAFYPEECLGEAANAFAEHCAADVIDRRPEAFALHIQVADGERKEAAAVVGAFLNYLLCLAAHRPEAAEPVA